MEHSPTHQQKIGLQIYWAWPLFILFMGFSRQEYQSGLPFPSPGGHILSELSTMTHQFWVALHGMAHSFIVRQGLWSMWLDWLVFCDCGFILSVLWWRRIRGLWKLPNRIDWLRGILGIVLMGGAMLSKSLIQFSVDRWSCVLSLVFQTTWPALEKPVCRSGSNS